MNLLTEGDFLTATDPIPVIEAWLAEAAASEPNDASAMALATAGPDGLPNVRMVLLKGFDERGFVFYTNAESAKGRELAQNPQAALVMHWKSLRRQVRARGRVTPVSAEEADAYFASRPLGSRIGAWASRQSRPLDRRETLEAAIKEIEAKHPDGAVPRPPHWPGYRIEPVEIELWQDRPSRLHDRIRFTRIPGGWDRTRLYP